MQRIKFINPNGREVVIGLAPPFLLEKVTGIGAEDANLITSNPASIDGAAFHGLQIKDREITVNLNIYGRTRAEMYENRQNLIALLASTRSAGGRIGTLEYANDHMTVWIPAVVKVGPQSTNRVGTYNTGVQVVFYCPDPFWRSIDQAINQIAYMGGGLTFPLVVESGVGVSFGSQGFEADMYNGGDAPAPLLITITGPSDQPEVVKKSTGEYIRVKRELYTGDTLTIDTTAGARAVIITRQNGEVESAFGYIDLTSTFFLLDPGDNVLQYLSGDVSTTARIQLAAYSRFGGV